MPDTVPFTYPRQYAGWWFITAPNCGRVQRTTWVLNRFAVAATSSASMKEHEAVARYGPQFRYVEARVYTSPRTCTVHALAAPASDPPPGVPRMPSLARPQHASQKPAFLALFEVFYDAHTLKGWLHAEPLQKSAELTQAPQLQQEHIDELVSPW
ncbi:uncharacterized protein BXZ73DRAFT_98215 [Epithele typhae]|uniref:uncharacterized protein n=1 Tax=Epithele typhae TaxID=378194 RepID=UPI002007402E|nr:uncharacterized protein BXZ73DRAFT_98215 [Epithele typhae]KAH9941827.1 hypothetical protein BXZ73DRAFT_98215 [Epithele typhae]